MTIIVIKNVPRPPVMANNVPAATAVPPILRPRINRSRDDPFVPMARRPPEWGVCWLLCREWFFGCCCCCCRPLVARCGCSSSCCSLDNSINFNAIQCSSDSNCRVAHVSQSKGGSWSSGSSDCGCCSRRSWSRTQTLTVFRACRIRASYPDVECNKCCNRNNVTQRSPAPGLIASQKTRKCSVSSRRSNNQPGRWSGSDMVVVGAGGGCGRRLGCDRPSLESMGTKHFP